MAAARATQPLHKAVEAGDISQVRLMLQAGQDVNYRDPGYYNYTPLMVAATVRRNDIAELLLRYGANTTLVDSFQETAVFIAVFANSPEVLETLLQHGSQVDAVVPVNGHPWTPLMFAVNTPAGLACAIVLLKYGASLRVSFPRGQTVIQRAMMLGYDDIVRLLQNEEIRRGELVILV